MRRFAFMAAYYGASAVYQGYMGLFYGEIGLSRGQIGAVNASTAVAALAVQPLWGALGDRVRRRTRLLCILAGASALLLPAALSGRGLWYQIAAAFAFYAFFSALLPMGDAVALASCGEQYGRIRLAGGISYAVFSLLGGWLLGRLPAGAAVWIASLLLAAAAFSALLLPEKEAKREKKRLLPALKDRRLRSLLIFMLPAQVGMGFYYGFYGLHFMSLPGASHFLLGAANLIAALAEIPYLLFSDCIFRRFGAGKTMAVATAVLCARFLLLGFSGNVYVALFSQVLNGFGYIAVGVSMAKYVSERLPGNAAGGQALISMLFYGASRLTGNLLGGLIAERTGIAPVFLIMAALCGASLAAYCAFGLRRRLRI